MSFALPLIAQMLEKAAPQLVPATDQPAADDGEGAFAAYFAEQSASARGTKTDKRGARIVGGRYNGKTHEEAIQIAREEFANFDDATKSQFAAKSRGDDLKPASSSMPFAQGSSMKDMRGKSVSFGPSASAPARADAMKAQSAATAQAGTNAVKAAQAQQAADPTGVAIRAQAAKDAVLAKDGVTDMGQGTMALSNPYGTGFAQQVAPGATRPPGRIFDEKGEVNMPVMMANQGKQLNKDGNAIGVPYLASGDGTWAAAADGVSSGIQQGIAAGAPGVAERRAGDVAKNAASFAASLPPAMQTAPLPASNQNNQMPSLARQSRPVPAPTIAPVDMAAAQKNSPASQMRAASVIDPLAAIVPPPAALKAPPQVKPPMTRKPVPMSNSVLG